MQKPEVEGPHITKYPTPSSDTNHSQTAGRFLLCERVANWLVLSLLLMFLSYALDVCIPISKPLWTPSFVLMTSGASLALLATLMFVIDIHGGYIRSKTPYKLVSDSLIRVGRNPLLLYILLEMVIGTLTIAIA